jgi:RNA polymerase sigma factor (sigma-70 family)
MLEASACFRRAVPDTRIAMAVRAPWRADDRGLAARAAGGDETAFEEIFERHHRGLLALCRHLLGSPEEAEDAVQHTFAAAYRQLDRGDVPKHLRAWLYATARNFCLDVLRRRRELPAAVPVASSAGLSEEVEARSDLRDLVADIGRLPDDQRAALVLSELGDLGHAEVAEVLGCPRAKVRALVYQARSSLAGWREARAMPCREVREEIAIARGGGLRRRHLRRHLKLCPDCAAFREDVDRQRSRVALLLPVVPTLGLKGRVLEAAAGAAGGGGAAAGSAGLGGALKIGAATVVLGGAGIATLGGLPGGGAPEGGSPHTPVPEAAPAAAPAQADPPPAGAGSRRSEEPSAQAGGKRLRVDERNETGPPAETVAPEPETQPDPAPEEPAPPPTAPEPTPSPPPPAPEPAPAPAPAPPEVPAENRSAQPQAEAEAELEADPPDALP